jgi:hypothetical protein
MPIAIENEEYEFDLLVSTVAAGKLEPEFNMFLDVKDTLVIFPVKFEIAVEPKQEEPDQDGANQEELNQEGPARD